MGARVIFALLVIVLAATSYFMGVNEYFSILSTVAGLAAVTGTPLALMLAALPFVLVLLGLVMLGSLYVLFERHS